MTDLYRQFKQEISTKISERMLDLGMTQAQVAQIVGIDDRSKLSKIIRGDLENVGLQLLLKVYQGLGGTAKLDLTLAMDAVAPEGIQSPVEFLMPQGNYGDIQCVVAHKALRCMRKSRKSGQRVFMETGISLRVILDCAHPSKVREHRLYNYLDLYRALGGSVEFHLGTKCPEGVYWYDTVVYDGNNAKLISVLRNFPVIKTLKIRKIADIYGCNYTTLLTMFKSPSTFRLTESVLRAAEDVGMVLKVVVK